MPRPYRRAKEVVGAGHVRPGTLASLVRGSPNARQGADNGLVAEKHAVECLRCGGFRTVARERTQRLDPGECPNCGYVGWALLTELTEATRKILRERPPEWRGDGGAGLRAV